MTDEPQHETVSKARALVDLARAGLSILGALAGLASIGGFIVLFVVIPALVALFVVLPALVGAL